jgi:hypothetical protein
MPFKFVTVHGESEKTSPFDPDSDPDPDVDGPNAADQPRVSSLRPPQLIATFAFSCSLGAGIGTGGRKKDEERAWT